MASVAGQQAQHLAGRGGRVPAPQVGLLDHAAHRGRPSSVCSATRRAPSLRTRACRGRSSQQAKRAAGSNTRSFSSSVSGSRKWSRTNTAVVADAVLVAGDDGRVRNRQPQRPAKQRHHREPVRQRAHRGRLAERPHPGPDTLPAHRVAGHGRRAWRPARQGGDLHAPQLRAARPRPGRNEERRACRGEACRSCGHGARGTNQLCSIPSARRRRRPSFPPRLRALRAGASRETLD